MSLADKMKNKTLQSPDGSQKIQVGEPYPEPEKEEFIYALVGLDNFSIHLGGDIVVAENKRLILNEEQNNELQGLIKRGRFDISQHLRRLDVKEAEKQAREYLASLNNNKNAAHRGASSTASNHEAMAQVGKDEIRNLDVIEEEALHGGDGPLKDPV